MQEKVSSPKSCGGQEVRNAYSELIHCLWLSDDSYWKKSGLYFTLKKKLRDFPQIFEYNEYEHNNLIWFF